MIAIGVDIGGTKCAVSLGQILDGNASILLKCQERETKAYSPYIMLDCLTQDILNCKEYAKNIGQIVGIGISCGGPLNSKTGMILSPPNLPGWNEIAIIDFFQEKTGLKAWLCNDANACALAEWKLGAGRGSSNMVFMTFGTGMGAGIILNNRLYSGTSDMAGEIGHIRLNDYGPSGYGKMGSFEGFCSGGGIAQLAKTMTLEYFQMGKATQLCQEIIDLDSITASQVGLCAKNGDPLALEVLKRVGIQLGYGLSILIDILNPEIIVIGSIFSRCYEEIWPWAKPIIECETLPLSRKVCQIVPSQLSESVGDIAGLVIADYNSKL